MPIKSELTREQAVRYIPCRVEPGMFRGEYLAYIHVGTLANPEEVVSAQLFVDHREVVGVAKVPTKNDPVPGFLRVQLAEIKGGYATIVLPQHAEPLGATVTVDEEQLKESPA